LERLDELIQETGYSVCQFRVGHFWCEPLSDLESAPIDQVSSVGGEEFVQHFESLRAFQSPLCAVAYMRRRQTCIAVVGRPAANLAVVS